jgi:hypothetical protein
VHRAQPLQQRVGPHRTVVVHGGAAVMTRLTEAVTQVVSDVSPQAIAQAPAFMRPSQAPFRWA